MELVVRHSGGIGMVILLFLCTLPPVLVFTIPMAVLVGVLIGLGRLSSDSEIVALHASGISLRRLLVPIGLVALAERAGRAGHYLLGEPGVSADTAPAGS